MQSARRDLASDWWSWGDNRQNFSNPIQFDTLIKGQEITFILVNNFVTINPEHKIYPYLLGDMKITRPNRVWASDITDIPMAQGFLYRAIIDVYSRYVLSWRLSNTPDAGFCIKRHAGSSRQSSGYRTEIS